MTGPAHDDGGYDRERTDRSQWVTYEIGEDERPSEAVVRAVAELTNRSPLELEPLYDVINPDHLDGILGETDDSVRAELSFTFGSCGVTVTGWHVRAHTKATDS